MDPQIAQAFSLEGKSAVITGGASGFGLEAGRIFAAAGARVMLADLNLAALKEARATFAEAGAIVEIRQTDVSDRKAVDALGEAAKAAFGRVDVWINSAGLPLVAPVLETIEEDAARVVAVNMMGTYWGCAAAARAMSQTGGGRIINISSAGSTNPVKSLSVYAMTKAAVDQLTRICALEFGPCGICVNAIAPGWVDTPMGSFLYRDEDGAIIPERKAAIVSETEAASPLGTIATATDIGLALLYLASEAGRNITGQVLRVNAGASM